MARPKTEKSCRNCRSVARVDDKDASGVAVANEVTGYCRRFPPFVVGPNQSSFPPVKLDGWACDEWKKA